MVIRYFGLSIFVTFFLNVHCIQAEPKLWVEKNPVTAGESFRMFVEVENEDDPEEPNLSLIKDIKVLNRSVQNQTSIVGTSISRKVSWTYEVVAMSPGSIQIPALRVGNGLTRPIMLEVLQQSKSSNAQEILVFEANLEPEQVYPQQQSLLTLKIIRKGIQLENESITPLEINNVRLRRVHQNSFRNIVNGQQQIVTEIRFALFAEKPGEITIPSIQYQGTVSPKGFQNRSFFQQRGSRLFRKSPPKQLTVLPIPGNRNGWWLPASNLILQETWEPNPPEFRVGEPVTRTIIIQAEGVEAEQLPDWETPDLSGIKIYAEPPVLETKETPQGVSALGKTSQALIPTSTGELLIPGIQIRWWDVQNRKFQVSQIPERRVNVLPPMDLIKTQESVQISKIPTQQVLTTTTENIHEDDQLWKYGTLFFFILWLMTMGLWYGRSVKTQGSSKIPEVGDGTDSTKNLKYSISAVETSILKKDPSLIRESILNWAKIRWPEDPPNRLQAICEKEKKLKDPLLMMERYHYAEQNEGWDAQQLAEAFKIVCHMPQEKIDDYKDRIRELYPA